MTEQALRGRAAELDVALAVLRRTGQTGQGAMIVVSGAGGIGKSALLTEICGQAARHGYGVGTGKAEESDQIAAMAPLLSALRSGREPLLSHQAFAALAPIRDQQLWLVDHLVDELETRALSGPVLVCVDDFQWADHSSAFAFRASWTPRRLSHRVAGRHAVADHSLRGALPDRVARHEDRAHLTRTPQP